MPIKSRDPKANISIRKLNSEPRKEYPFYFPIPRRSEAVISSDKVEISIISKTFDMPDLLLMLKLTDKYSLITELGGVVLFR